MHRLIDLSCKPKKAFHLVRLNLDAKQDISWWLGCLDIFNGTCKFRCDLSLPSYVYATDACESGGGGFWMDDWFYVNWQEDIPELVGAHINQLELAAVVIALMRWGPTLAGTHVRIRSDNMATVAAVNKSTSRSPTLMPWVRELFWLGVKYDITLSCVHIPGVENYVADRISRLNCISDAMDARLILSNFSNSMVFCKDHMTYQAFICLQGCWTEALAI
jgi:hypothetical protein